jgi:hypothetical protein
VRHVRLFKEIAIPILKKIGNRIFSKILRFGMQRLRIDTKFYYENILKTFTWKIKKLKDNINIYIYIYIIMDLRKTSSARI